MKKIAYMTPNMEVVKFSAPVVLQAASDGTQPDYGGAGDPDQNEPD